MSRCEKCVWRGFAAGMVGGVVASWTMNKAQSLLSRMRQQQSQSERQQSSSDEPATVKAAEAVSKRLFGHELTASEKEIGGEAAHYAMGTATGAIYGAMAEAVPEAASGRGLLFGTALWLIADETIVPALGLSKPAFEYPASTHAYAWASHLIYAVTVDTVRRGIVRLF